jgi:hypothetical protein
MVNKPLSFAKIQSLRWVLFARHAPHKRFMLAGLEAREAGRRPCKNAAAANFDVYAHVNYLYKPE